MRDRVHTNETGNTARAINVVLSGTVDEIEVLAAELEAVDTGST